MFIHLSEDSQEHAELTINLTAAGLQAYHQQIIQVPSLQSVKVEGDLTSGDNKNNALQILKGLPASTVYVALELVA